MARIVNRLQNNIRIWLPKQVCFQFSLERWQWWGSSNIVWKTVPESWTTCGTNKPVLNRWCRGPNLSVTKAWKREECWAGAAEVNERSRWLQGMTDGPWVDWLTMTKDGYETDCQQCISAHWTGNKAQCHGVPSKISPSAHILTPCMGQTLPFLFILQMCI